MGRVTHNLELLNTKPMYRRVFLLSAKLLNFCLQDLLCTGERQPRSHGLLSDPGNEVEAKRRSIRN